MADVRIVFSTRSGSGGQETPDTAALAVATLAERGSATGVVTVRSYAELLEKVGDPVSYSSLHAGAQGFFAEGGGTLHLLRVVGPAAAVSSRIVQDRSGTPVNTARVDAANPGGWGTRITEEVVAGTAAGTFRWNVYFDGVLVESADNLASVAAAVTAFGSSPWIRIVNLNSIGSNPLPVLHGPTALTGGADDRASVTPAMMTNAFARLGSSYGPCAVAVPGFPADLVGAALLTHVGDATHPRVALLAGDFDDTAAQLVTLAAALPAASGKHAAFFGPWPVTPDGAIVPPEWYAGALRARAHATVGPWRAPAAGFSESRYFTRLSAEFTVADVATLTAGRVNALVTAPGGGIELEEWLSLSTDRVNYTFLSVQDLLNAVAEIGRGVLGPRRYEPITDDLLRGIQASMNDALERYKNGGAFASRDGDRGYIVDIGPDVNTPTTLANNELKMRVGVRPSAVARFLTVEVVRTGFTATL